MPRRSSRASSAVAASKISDAAENNNFGEDDVISLENGGSSLSAAAETNAPANLKGADAKKVPRERASPKKKEKDASKRTKSKGAASDDGDGDCNGTLETKTKAAPKKRKSKGASSPTTTTTSDDEEEASSSAAATKEPNPPAKKKKSAAADHQRWTERSPLVRHWDPERAMASRGSYTFTVVSWNVAGLRAFVKKRPDALADLARKVDADVICLQETKLQEGHWDDPKLKLSEHFEEKLPGYDGYWCYSVVKKGYSGTAMFIRKRSVGDGRDGGKNGNKGEASKKGKKQVTLGAFFGSSKKKSGGEADASEKGGNNGEMSTGGVPISHLKPIGVSMELGLPEHDGEGRTITAEFPLFYLTNVYVPNSGQKLDRLGYRTERWDADFLAAMQRLEREGNKPIIWLGDLNVAFDEKDTWNEGAKHLTKSAGTTPEERASFARQLAAGYVDAFRKLYPEGRGHYTYWSQRAGNREPNKGLRLDYFVCSAGLMEDGDTRKAVVRDSYMVPEELGSDHCPIVLEIEMKK